MTLAAYRIDNWVTPVPVRKTLRSVLLLIKNQFGKLRN